MKTRWVKVAILVLVVGIGGWYGGHWLYWRWADSLPRGPAPPPGVIAWIKEVPGKKPMLVVDEKPGGKRLYQAECDVVDAPWCEWSPDGRTVVVRELYEDRDVGYEFFRPFQPSARRASIRLGAGWPFGRPRYLLTWCSAETVAIADQDAEIREMWAIRAVRGIVHAAPREPVCAGVLSAYRVVPFVSRRASVTLPWMNINDISGTDGQIWPAGSRLAPDGGETIAPCILIFNVRGNRLTENRRQDMDLRPGPSARGLSVAPKPQARSAAAVALRVWSPGGWRVRVEVVDLDKRTQVEVGTFKVADTSLCWSPDGSRLLLHCWAGPGGAWRWEEIALVHEKGRCVTVATSPDDSCPAARWSPSGRQLAVTVWNDKTTAWEGRVLEIADDLSFKVVHVEPNARAVAWFQGPGK